ncbi:MAG: hypothetical protein Q7K26_01965 [bacterium]|nr:hypothetical protein [bacterium]
MKHLVTSIFLISLFASYSNAAEPSSHFQAPSANDTFSETQMLTIQGRKPITISILNGFGKEIPLMEATKLILPKGIIAIFDESVSGANVKVSWRGGNTWLSTLAQILQQARVSAVMNFDSMQLTISTFDPQSLAVQAPPLAVPRSAEINGVQQKGNLIVVTLENQVSEIYIVDRLRQRDIPVVWISPTAFTFPISVSDKIRITTDKGASNITRLNGNWMIGGA